jgi:hypothetical protein
MTYYNELLDIKLKNAEESAKKIIKSHRHKISSFLDINMGVQLDFLPTINYQKQEDPLYEILCEECPDFDFEEYFNLLDLDSILDSTTKKINDQNILEHTSRLRYEIRRKKFEYERLTEKIRQLLLNKNLHREPDTFGYYAYNRSNGNRNHYIQINLLTCIFFAQEKLLDPNYLILSTYIHELTHFQSHEGKDKDGKKWDAFAEVDSFTKEGIAQYFSHEYFKSMDKKEVFDRIENLKDDLGNHYFNEVYREYLKYLPFSREQVYFAFVKFRRNNLTQSAEFMNLLKRAEIELPRKF